MLAVVEHQQQLLALDVAEQKGRRIGGCLVAQVEGRHHGVGDEARIAHVGKLDQPGARGKRPAEVACRPDGQARLAYPAGTDQGDNPGRRQLLPQIRQLALAAHEARGFSREIAQTADRPGHGGAEITTARGWTRGGIGKESVIPPISRSRPPPRLGADG